MSTTWPPRRKLVIDRELLREIVDHCRREEPREACGLISGLGERARRVTCLRNVASDPETRYLIGAEEQFASFKGIRDAGEELLAIYHSHPRTEAVPSERDIDLAFYPECFYLLVSLSRGEALARAFCIRREEHEVVEAELRVVEEGRTSD